VVIRPREKFSSYFSEIRAGKRRPPRAMMVMPVAPVMAVKKAHETSATTPRPPGSHPKRLLENLTRRVEVPPWERRYPAKVNRGIANNTGALARRKISIGMAARSTPLTWRPSMAAVRMPAKSGRPEMIRIMRMITSIRIMITSP
jgi:hypothetical protein